MLWLYSDFVFFMIRQHPRSPRTGTLCPYTTRFRSRLVAATGGLVGAVALLRRRLGVALGETDETLRAEGCEDAALDLLGLRLAVDALSTGNKTDKEIGRAHV